MAQKDTPSMAKNKIKRSLWAICDPHPTQAEKNKLWQHFESCCAYCGIFIEPSSRIGHLDHLVPTSEGGSNSIYNHALSCATCNGDEKREESWQSFLAKKCQNSDTEALRRNKIAAWMASSPTNLVDSELAAKIDAVILEAIQSYEASVNKIRQLKASHPPRF